MKDNLGALPGSHASHEAPSGLRPSGFDPARLGRRERELFDALDATWRHLKDLGLNPNTQMLIPPAKALQKMGVVERRHGPGYLSLYRRIA